MQSEILAKECMSGDLLQDFFIRALLSFIYRKIKYICMAKKQGGRLLSSAGLVNYYESEDRRAVHISPITVMVVAAGIGIVIYGTESSYLLADHSFFSTRFGDILIIPEVEVVMAGPCRRSCGRQRQERRCCSRP
ncbi:MAG: preprotein translocase subunit Sec61beta [Marinilabiliales bacterium]|nr:preprotein translocase subunit Sec61beta [Marinilabiliales bacterium]